MRYTTAKVSMAAFIFSEATFFIFLIFAYVYYHGAISSGPDAAHSLDPPVTLIYTICLIASSATLYWAERRLRAKAATAFRVGLGATVILGAVFIFGQASEYVRLITSNVVPARNLFAATFFTLTGFHGFHVVCGLIALLVILGIATWSEIGEKDEAGLGAVSMYWHFVDAVWIVIFSIVYVSVWL